MPSVFWRWAGLVWSSVIAYCRTTLAKYLFVPGVQGLLAGSLVAFRGYDEQSELSYFFAHLLTGIRQIHWKELEPIEIPEGN